MGSQTRTVLKAFLAGIAFVALREASGAVTEPGGYIPPIDTSPLNADLGYRIGYWMGHWAAHWAVRGIIPLLFSVIAIAATAYKAGLRSSISNALGAAASVAGLAIVTSCAQVAIAAIYPAKELPFADPGVDRDTFVRGVLSTCAKRQQTFPENKGVSAAAIDAFCLCYANSMADVVTKHEAAFMLQHKYAPSFTGKVNTVSQKCQALALKQN